MPYVSLIQLAEAPGALELAQIASDEHQPIVDAELMELTLRAGNRSAYSAEQIAAADAAKARIEQISSETDQQIDGYLRFRYTLPLSPMSPLLAVWARSIVRYRLHKNLGGDDRSNPVVRDYRDALKFLAEVRDGRFSLGANDTTVAPEGMDARFESSDRVFSRAQLTGFR